MNKIEALFKIQEELKSSINLPASIEYFTSSGYWKAINLCEDELNEHGRFRAHISLFQYEIAIDACKFIFSEDIPYNKYSILTGVSIIKSIIAEEFCKNYLN